MNCSRFRIFVLALILILPGPAFEQVLGAQAKAPDLGSSQHRDAQRLANLVEEVRHQLVMLPYYSVFDWLEGEAKADGTVILRGQVVKPTAQSDAEFRIKRLESVTKLENALEVLPVSATDDQLRVALYRAIYDSNTPLFRYATQSVPPIHIIVKNGHVTLKGVVASQGDSQLAYTAARGVPGTFSVENNLKVAP